MVSTSIRANPVVGALAPDNANRVAISDVADSGTLEHALLTQADATTRSPDGRTSLRELDRYLSARAHADVRSLVDGPRLESLRAKLPSAAVGRSSRAQTSALSTESILAARTITADQAAQLIKPGDRVLIPIGHMGSAEIIDALKRRALQPDQLDASKPVRLFGGAHIIDPMVYATGGKVVPESIFIDACSRQAYAAGLGDFIPIYLHRIPSLVRDGRLPVDVAVVRVTEPDEDGYVSLGTTAVFGPAGIDAAKTVIAEMNPNVPRTRGETKVHVSKLDHIVRSRAPMFPVPVPEVSEIDAQIAKNIVGLIPEGATLQFGIGGVPNAVASALAAEGRRGLHVRSEMISDGVMKLAEAGAIDGDIEFAFAMGSQDLLQWMNNNPRLNAKSVDKINEPSEIRKIDKFVAVNTALRIDLKGQANAQQINGTMYSGVGGQVDFMRGASASRDGRAILALPSVKTIKNAAGEPELISTIVPRLTGDDVVTTPMHDVQYVVTEHGVAYLDGKTMTERARALIAVADPRFRPALQEELETLLRRRAAAAG
ncbi:MAG: acetyl-CoA hydrolase/transferase family protein [Deltaproteobacteria bacterium]|nr:acetyl-CoA hydrolase/transferase family protein [Deltaproteobacteria bacterium]